MREPATRDWANKGKGVRSKGWREAPDSGSDAPSDYRGALVDREAKHHWGAGGRAMRWAAAPHAGARLAGELHKGSLLKVGPRKPPTVFAPDVLQEGNLS